MTQENQEKKSNAKPLIITVAVIIVIILIGAGIFFLRKTEKAEAPAAVGQINRDKIMESDIFQEADEKIKALTSEYEAKFEEATKDFDEEKEADRTSIIQLRQQYQQELVQKSNQILNPVWEKAATAVAMVAVEKKMDTVLDKQIVVCGAHDITDDVLKLLESGEELKRPEDETVKKLEEQSRIGYFDKNVVLSLNMFNQARAQIDQMEQAARAEYEKRSENMTEEEKAQLAMSYMEQINKSRDDMLAPMFRQVNRTVKKVAQDRQLNLVIDKERVMYGGRNITDEIADELSGSGETVSDIR